MHSSLAPHLHEECLDVIDMLKACHEEVWTMVQKFYSSQFTLLHIKYKLLIAY